MLAALRFRRAQAVVVAALSALVITCLVLAPLYSRALQQATASSLLARAPAGQTSVLLTSSSSTAPTLALKPDALAELVPASVRDLFGPSVGSTTVGVRLWPLLGEPEGRLVARDGVCEHLRFTAGRCPTAANEVAVSADQSAAYRQPVGARFEVGEWDEAVSLPQSSPRTTVQVVGVYEPVDGAYWSGQLPTGTAAKKLGFDTMFTPQATVDGQRATAPDGSSTSWFMPQYGADLPLASDRVGIDRIGDLGSTVSQLITYPMGPENAASEVADTVTVRSGLPPIADEVERASAQAAVTVPLLMAQMGLLLGCVLWLVLVAAADQRRGEVAVARLRGRGAGGARRLLLAETLPPVLVGVPLGALLAVGVSTAARHLVLTGDPPFEIPRSAVVALVAGLLLMVGLAVLSVRRVCREPVATLTRSVPPRPTGVRLGVLEAMLVAAALAAFVALVTGSVQGPVGQVAPTLLALAAGVVAARLMSSVLSAGGKGLLRRGRPTAGGALLAASRRTTTRWLIPVVTVALCLVVVTTDAVAVGARNWAGRGAAEVGAPAVLTLDSVDLRQVTQAVKAIDPTGLQVTPVAVVAPRAEDGSTVVGVDPSSFRHVALWPGVATDDLAWDTLTAPTVAPLVLTGRRVGYHVSASAFELDSPVLRSPPTTLTLALRAVAADGTTKPLALGSITDGGTNADQTATVDCATGCRVSGLGLLAPPNAAAVHGTVSLSGLTIDGKPVDLGATTDWRDTSTSDTQISGQVSGATADLTYAINGADSAYVTHASIPDVVPALTTAASTPSGSATFAGAYVDGSPMLLTSTGQVPFVPGGPPASSMVNIGNLLAQGWTGRGSAVLRAYVATADPVALARIGGQLRTQGVGVTSTTLAADVAQTYAQSAAAWSLQLALAVGVLSLLVAGVGIVVLASTSWRARSRDYAGLRLVGQGARGVRRFAQLETVPVVVVAAALGIGVGLWAAPVALGLVPLFTSPPATYPVDLGTSYTPALVAGAVGLVALALVGAVTSRRIAARSDMQRLRDAA